MDLKGDICYLFQAELEERMTTFDESPKNNVESYINKRVDKLTKIIIESTGSKLPDTSKLVLMAIYGFSQTIVLVVIFFKFFQAN